MKVYLVVLSSSGIRGRGICLATLSICINYQGKLLMKLIKTFHKSVGMLDIYLSLYNNPLPIITIFLALLYGIVASPLLYRNPPCYLLFHIDSLSICEGSKLCILLSKPEIYF